MGIAKKREMMRLKEEIEKDPLSLDEQKTDHRMKNREEFALMKCRLNPEPMPQYL